MSLKAPYPYFGGKRRVAELVWARFGNPAVYVEPFFGSGAMLLARPHLPGKEMINDIDGFLVNFWRAVKSDPMAVAAHADWIISEQDLLARHHWLVNEGAKRIEGLSDNPNRYDAQVAGWWLWGMCLWLGNGWCDGEGKYGLDAEAGIKGVHPQIPHMGPGRGVFRKVPNVPAGTPGFEAERSAYLREMMQLLGDRLREVRVSCGDWKRLMGESISTDLGVTAVFLDPPYLLAGRAAGVYNNDTEDPAREAIEWCIANGDNPKLRIALCGYEGDYVMPDTWIEIPWKTQGGYGNLGDGAGKENAKRERIWFSPHCIDPAANKPTAVSLFAALTDPQ
jgi:hypothetical protein